jgi:hypothetical protein
MMPRPKTATTNALRHQDRHDVKPFVLSFVSSRHGGCDDPHADEEGGS